MIKKIVKILVWTLIVSYLVFALVFVADKRKKVKCTSIDIQIVDTTNNYFIDREDVLQMISDRGEQLINKDIEDINIAKLEELLINHPSIKNAEVFKDMDGELKIEIEQRNPIIRIINYNGESYYIDEDARLMQLSENYTARVLVATGDINEPLSRLKKVCLTDTLTMQDLVKRTILPDLYKLAKYIYDDKFFKAMIEQIYVKQDGSYELISKIGNNLIELGDTTDYKDKFTNLKAVYEKGFPTVGWNQYDTINIKYKNQVICTKKVIYESEPESTDSISH